MRIISHIDERKQFFAVLSLQSIQRSSDDWPLAIERRKEWRSLPPSKGDRLPGN
jgi:hypothetical protein